jgi:hypothetical protein
LIARHPHTPAWLKNNLVSQIVPLAAVDDVARSHAYYRQQAGR